MFGDVYSHNLQPCHSSLISLYNSGHSAEFVNVCIRGGHSGHRTISSRHHLCILNKRIYSHKLLFNVVAARETSGQLDHLSSILQNYQMVDHVYMRMKEKPMCSFLSLHFYVARDKSIVYLYFSVNYK